MSRFVGRLIRNRHVCRGLFAVGLGLLGLNVAGLIIPLRHPDIYHEPANEFTNDITLTAAEFHERIRRHGQSDLEFATNLVNAIYEGMAHYYEEDDARLRKYRWRLPIYENYLLYLSRHALHCIRWARGQLNDPSKPPVYTYEFSGYRKAIERGVGLCSQHTVVTMQVLRKEHIPARQILLKQHVLATARVDPVHNTWWILDADYGVTLPFDLATVKANPEIIRPYYEARGHKREIIDGFVEYFRDPVAVVDSVAQVHGKARYYFEFISYYLVWIIPLLLALPLTLSRIRRLPEKNRRASSDAVGDLS